MHPPEEDRACLARAILDSLGLHSVPVGVRTNGGTSQGGTIEFHCFDSVFVDQKSSFHFESGTNLMKRVLEESEPKSVKLLCMASVKDVSQFMTLHNELFVDKIKEVVIMGGVTYSKEVERLVPDESAYNNYCDIYPHDTSMPV